MSKEELEYNLEVVRQYLRIFQEEEEELIDALRQYDSVEEPIACNTN